jgi:hypothetical protein
MNNKKKFLLLILIIIFLFNKSQSKELKNKIIVSIDNLIITELDVNKEVMFLRFIQNNETNINSEILKKEATQVLIDRKIKDIETNYFKIQIEEKELENNLYSYLANLKTNNIDLDSFYIKNEIENDYLRNIIKIDMKWTKLIRQMYESRININLTEIDKEIEEKKINTEDNERLRQQLFINEQNKLLNKFSLNHLEKSKKKYLIKFL